MKALLDFVRGVIAKEPARFTAYAVAGATAAALKLAELAGIKLGPETLAAVAAIATIVATEAIRLFVTPVAHPELPSGTEVKVQGTEDTSVV